MRFSEWKNCKLGEIINFRRGHDLPKTKMVDGDYPVVGSNGVIGYHNEYKSMNPCITVGRSGNVGNPHIVRKKCWAHNTTLYIDNFKGNDPEFIYYMLFILRLFNYRGGSAVPTLNRNHIHPIDVNLPASIKEQKAIANILSTLDEKIEVNSKINKTLENIAQAIFKQWFVDFEFPNENGKPYKSGGGKMIESELGLIPEGWEVKSIGDISEIQNGFAFKAPEYTEKGIKVLRTLNISSNGYFENKNLVFLPDEYLTDKFSKYIFKEFDIALVMVGASIGKIGMVLSNTSDALQNQNMWRFRSKKDNVNQIYLYYLVQQAQKISVNWSTGSAREFYRKDSFSKVKILVSSMELLEVFKQLVKPFFNKISKLVCENESLVELRDALLPKLMSGEIRVPLDKEGEVS